MDGGSISNTNRLIVGSDARDEPHRDYLVTRYLGENAHISFHYHHTYLHVCDFNLSVFAFTATI